MIHKFFVEIHWVKLHFPNLSVAGTQTTVHYLVKQIVRKEFPVAEVSLKTE